MERGFDEVLRSFRATGQVAGLAPGAPVLVRYGDDGADEAGDRAFRTAFGRASEHGTVADPEAERERALGAVVSVVKKAGAPFPEQIGVGRAANTDVCLTLTRLSKYHAFFQRTGEGAYAVADAGSKNGTWLNGARLAPKVAVPIADGARLRVGPYKFLFHTWPGFMRLLEQRADR